MKLVPDWKQCWRWYSMHTSAFGFVFTTASASIALSSCAAAWSQLFDLDVVLWIAAGIFALNMVGRLLLQERRPR